MAISTIGASALDGDVSQLGKNLIINGAMAVDQRGSTAISAGGTGYGGPDRWEALSGVTAAYTLSADSDVPTGQGFSKSLKVDITTGDASISSGEHYHVRTKLEGTNVAHLMLGTANAKTVTLQFWARSRVTGIHCVALQNSAENRSYVFEYTIASADTWEFFTKTIALDQSGTWLTTTGIGLSVVWSLGAGSSYQGTADTWNAADDEATSNQVNVVSGTGTFGLAGVQLEVGSVATDFEHEPYSATFAKCLRYYYRMEGNGTGRHIASTYNASTTVAEGGMRWPVEMRAAPTIGKSADGDFFIRDTGGEFAVTTLGSTIPSTFSVRWEITCSGGGLTDGYGSQLVFDATSGNYLDFSAEL